MSGGSDSLDFRCLTVYMGSPSDVLYLYIYVPFMRKINFHSIEYMVKSGREAFQNWNAITTIFSDIK
jgi:hypothetical protein